MWVVYRAPHISLSLLCLIKLEPNTNNKTKGNCAAAIWTALRRFHFHLSSIPPSAAFNYAKRNTDLKQTSGGNTAFCLALKGVRAQTQRVYNCGRHTQGIYFSRSMNTAVKNTQLKEIQVFLYVNDLLKYQKWIRVLGELRSTLHFTQVWGIFIFNLSSEVTVLLASKDPV